MRHRSRPPRTSKRDRNPSAILLIRRGRTNARALCSIESVGPFGLKDKAPGGAALRFAILGPMQVSTDAHTVPLIPFKQRVVLGLLLCRANRVVPVSDLQDALWCEEA